MVYLYVVFFVAICKKIKAAHLYFLFYSLNSIEIFCVKDCKKNQNEVFRMEVQPIQKSTLRCCGVQQTMISLYLAQC